MIMTVRLRRATVLLPPAAAAALHAMLFVASPAGAAVRYCLDPIAVIGLHQTSMDAARRQALERWKAAARRHGEGWSSWQLSTKRRVQCKAHPTAGYACAIVATPCAITNNPVRPPRTIPGRDI